MAKFNSANLNPTEYDFTEFPHKDQPDDEGAPVRYCTGIGVIAEPSDEQMDEFQAAARELEKAGSDESMTFTQARAATTKTLAKLNVPAEHLDELPPKYFTAFVTFVLGEFTPGNGLGA